MRNDNLNKAFHELSELANVVTLTIQQVAEALQPLVELAKKDKRYKRVFYLAAFGKKPRTRKKNKNRLIKLKAVENEKNRKPNKSVCCLWQDFSQARYRNESEL